MNREFKDKEEQRQTLEAAISATRMPMIVTDPRIDDNPIIYVNDAFLKLTGYDLDEVIGRNCRFMQGKDTDPDAVKDIRAAISDGVPVQSTLLNYRKDGTSFWNQLFVSPVTDDQGNIIHFFGSQVDVTMRLQLEKDTSQLKARIDSEVRDRTADLSRVAAQRGNLLHELHHRMKNNLQMISSLISVQASEAATSGARAIFDSMRTRVEALAGFYELAPIDTDDALVEVSVGDYISTIVENLRVFLRDDKIRIETSLTPNKLPMNIVLPLGLILNELLTNSLRHAFQRDMNGVIRVEATIDDGILRAAVEDNGQGLPADFENNTEGVGLTVVRGLVEQLNGTMRFNEVDPTRVEIFVDLDRARDNVSVH